MDDGGGGDDDDHDDDGSGGGGTAAAATAAVQPALEMYRVAIFPGRVGFGFLRKNPVGFGSGLPGDFVLNFFRKFAKRCKIFAAFRLFYTVKLKKY